LENYNTNCDKNLIAFPAVEYGGSMDIVCQLHTLDCALVEARTIIGIVLP